MSLAFVVKSLARTRVSSVRSQQARWGGFESSQSNNLWNEHDPEKPLHCQRFSGPQAGFGWQWAALMR
jgi:hypothetical protein